MNAEVTIEMMNSLRSAPVMAEEKRTELITDALEAASKILWLNFHGCQLNNAMGATFELPDANYTIEFKKIKPVETTRTNLPPQI